jgi:hypothetical protein
MPRTILAATLAALTLLGATPRTAPAGGRAVYVWDGSGTMLLRFDGPRYTRYGLRGPGSRYPFWWYGYEGPERWRDRDPAPPDPALGVGPTAIYRFVFPNRYFDGGYYDLFEYTGRFPSVISPFASSNFMIGPYAWRPWWWQRGTYDGPVLYGRTSKVDPALLGTQGKAGPAFEEPDPIPFQAAIVALLREGEYDAAIQVWRRAASGTPVKATGLPAYPGATPPQVPVTVEGVWRADRRLRAVALVGVGKLDAAATEMADAYLIDPRLAGLPLADDLVAPGPRDLRRLVLDAIRHADRNPSAEAWLLAGVLTQAEGRDRVAAKFVGRAEAAGLDRDIAGALYDALGGRPAPEGR